MGDADRVEGLDDGTTAGRGRRGDWGRAKSAVLDRNAAALLRECDEERAIRAETGETVCESGT
jgi:hypothetical protein